MVNRQSIRSFLRAYRDSSIFTGSTTPPTTGESPPTRVRSQQKSTLEESDQHVIPLAEYEFRIFGRDESNENRSGLVRFEDELQLVEEGWERIVAKWGYDAVSTYVPFHEDKSTYGIYISQRGIRYLGHLLYHWSRVGDLADTSAEAKTILEDQSFSNGDRLYDGDPQFDSIEAAFELARELLLRYQWFHHQFELLAAHLEDIRDEQIYTEYDKQERSLSADTVTTLSSNLALAYTARSQACRTRAPNGLFRPLFWRSIPSHTKVHSLTQQDDFEDGCYSLSANLLSNSSQLQDGVELARQLPFDTAAHAAIPDCISVYISRRESDPNNGSYATHEHPLNVDWTVETTETWESARSKADGSLLMRVEDQEDTMRDNPKSIKWKGKGQGPRNTYYGNLTKKKRFVFKADEFDQTVTLVDFGGHDLPKRYGLHVN